MTRSLDHESCSSLLRAYVAGNAEDDASAVAAHLEQCDQCRAEEKALRAMFVPVDPPTSAERARLRAGVFRSIRPAPAARPDEEPTSSSPPQERSWKRNSWWLGGVVGAAAAVLAVIVAGGFFLNSVGGSSSFNQPAAGGAAAPNGVGPEPADSLGLHSNSVLPGHSLPLPAFASAVPSAHSAKGTATDRVQEQASPLLANFSHTYKGSHVTRLAGPFLIRLANLAPATVSAQVQECAATVLPGAGLPAFGAVADQKGTRVLILIFASASSPDAPLETSHLFAWPLGSCNRQLVHVSAPIAR